jgi:anti-sigma factor ChrR (cupin superfamily)
MRGNVKHPTFDELEAYALNTLGPVNDRSIEEHLLVCDVCRNRLQSHDWLVRAIRTSFPNDDFTHATSDGNVRVWIEQSAGGWMAGVTGGKLDLVQPARTAERAVVLVATSFYEAYPGHRCNAGCGSRPKAETRSE